MLLEIKAQFKTLDEYGTIEGLAAGFGNLDYNGDIIEKNATVSADYPMPMLWQHRSDMPVGVWTSGSNTPDGYKTTGVLNSDVQLAREARSLLKQGAITGLSIGFEVVEATAGEGGVRMINAFRIHEVSLVTFPANPKTRVSSVKSAKYDLTTVKNRCINAADIFDLLHEAGFSKSASKYIKSVLRTSADETDTDAGHGHDVAQPADEWATVMAALKSIP